MNISGLISALMEPGEFKCRRQETNNYPTNYLIPIVLKL